MKHGYFNRGDFASGDGTDRAAEFLNKRGYLTISPDYRSWGGSDIGSSLFYSGLVTDVINLLDALRTIPEADAERVGMWGHSMGGGVTIKALTILGGRVVPSDSEEHTLAPGASAGVETTVRAAVLYSTVSADDADILLRWGLGCIGDIGAGELQLGCNSAEIVPLCRCRRDLRSPERPFPRYRTKRLVQHAQSLPRAGIPYIRARGALHFCLRVQT